MFVRIYIYICKSANIQGVNIRFIYTYQFVYIYTENKIIYTISYIYVNTKICMYINIYIHIYIYMFIYIYIFIYI